MSLRLRPMTGGDEHVARQAHEELARDGFAFLLDLRDGEPWPAYVERHRRLHRGLDVPPDRVPATFLLACVDGEVVGRVSVRHELNAWLLRHGGHIGYGVRPAHRGRGWATEVLRQSLVVARAEGVDRVLITCDDDNAASAATITRCGGVLADVVPGPDGPTRRYWVD